MQHRQLQGEHRAWREMRFLTLVGLSGVVPQSFILLLLQEMGSFVPHTVWIELSAAWGKGESSRESQVVITVTETRHGGGLSSSPPSRPA